MSTTLACVTAAGPTEPISSSTPSAARTLTRSTCRKTGHLRQDLGPGVLVEIDAVAVV
jgi:hypothetical protein